MPAKLPPPVSKCTRCGHLRRDVRSIGGRCVRRPDGKRCEGFYLSVMSTTDWQECSTCHATGYENTARCSQCDGDGSPLADRLVFRGEAGIAAEEDGVPLRAD